MNADTDEALPEWVKEHAVKCCAALGISHYEINIRSVPKIKGKVKKGGRIDGHNTFDYAYLFSRIKILDSLEPEASGLQTLTHEMLHVALAEFREVTDQMLYFVPRQHRRECNRLYNNASERTIERLARSLTPVIAGADEDVDDGECCDE